MRRFYIINEDNEEEFDWDWYNEAIEEGSCTEDDLELAILELTKENKQTN
jgi:hypothetical protein